ncbi:MAG: ubiquitin-like domain-containing protein [Anaerolineae bacterium]
MPSRRSTLPRTIQALLVLVLSALALATGYRATLVSITLEIDGHSRQLLTHQDSVAAVLVAYDVSTRPEDAIFPRPSTALRPGTIIRIQRAHPVNVSVDGQSLTLLTRAESVDDVLREARVTLGPHDELFVEGDLRNEALQRESPRVIIHRSVLIAVQEGDETASFHTTASTVGEALRRAGYTLYLADRVRPRLGTRVSPGMAVHLERSKPVTIRVDGRTLRTRTHRDDPYEVLADLGIVLNGQDYASVTPDPDIEGGELASSAPLPGTAVAGETTIEVVRVTERFLILQEPIPYESVWRPDPDLEIDNQRLLQEGSPGVRERRIRVRYENSQEVSRTVENVYVAVPPTTNIRGYGTKIIVRTVNTPSGPRDYWRTIRMLATSYSASTAGVSPSSPHYGRTATGMTMRDGIVAVDPRVINLRSEVYVPGYGVGLAGDTGGAIKGKRIDLGYDDDNLQLWYRWVDVYLLTPVPPASRIDYTLP